jgi:FAD/FMN-containing dehydrogenase
VQPALAGLSAALAPHTTGRTFVNLHGHPGDEPDRARAWAPEQYARLRRVKGRYDPGNTFRFGHAISPAS